MTSAPKPGSWLSKVVSASTTIPKRVLCDNAGANEVEIWLQSFGVSYSEKLDLPISMVDVKKSQQNQARAEAIVPDSVDRFATALKNGAEFRPVVGYKSGNSVVLIDGNNRCAAYLKEKREMIPAYVVHPDTPSEVIHAMTVSANTTHGHTPDKAWRIQQAEFLVGIGYSQDEACRLANVRVHQLQDHQRAERATIRARTLKISGFLELPTGHKLRLGALQSDPIFLQAARVVIDTNMLQVEVDNFTKEIRNANNETLQVAVISRIAEDRKMAAKNKAAMGKHPRIKSSKTNLLTGLGKIMAADPGQLSRMVLTDMERIEMSKRLAAAADRILELQIALETVAKEEMRDVG